MAINQMLPEMVVAVELFGFIALATLVNGDQMLDPPSPVRLRTVGECFATVATYVTG
jgi:hypothetical protein